MSGRQRQHPFYMYTGSQPPDQSVFFSATNLPPRDRIMSTKKPWVQRIPSSGSMGDGEQERETKSVKSILSRFANRTSMQGVSFLSTSRSSFARITWTCLLLASLSILTWHLTYLIQNYYSWPKTTSVNLGFQSLQFPAITICNVNPFRKSKLNKASKDLQRLINETEPKRLASNMEAHFSWHGVSNGTKMNATVGAAAKNGTDDADKNIDMSFINNLNLTFSRNPRMNMTMEQNSKDGQGMGLTEKSTVANILQDFRYLFVEVSRESRIKMGHNIEDMLLDCSFACQRCSPKNFHIKTSSNFGNCYTLHNRLFKSKRSGPPSGLQLILYLETNEYLSGLTMGNGMQVVVHAPGTMPFPDNDGIAVAAGTETNVALRLLKVARLGAPNWDCEDGQEFMRLYNVTYTRQTCQAFCEHRHIVEACKCYDNTNEEINMAMKYIGKYPPCSTSNVTQLKCLMDTTWKYESNKLECDCGNPCSEVKYEKTMSSRQWPSNEYANVLIQTLCQRGTYSQCTKLKKDYKDMDVLRQNFIKLNIYYEDLNYENISEEPDYQFIQFVADVGGTLGLWVGLSTLSLFEVVQLILELLAHFTCATWWYKNLDDDEYKRKEVKKQWLVPTESSLSGKLNNGFSGY